MAGFALWLEGERQIVTLDVDGHAVIHIYEDRFCDMARIPTFEIERNGRVLARRYSTELWLECGEDFHAERFRIVSTDDGNTHAVVYDYGSSESLAVVFNSRSLTAVPNPDTPQIPEEMHDLFLPE